MRPIRQRETPYIWVTWLASLLAGDNHCEWAAWFRAHFLHETVPSDFDAVKWQAEHNDMLRARVSSLKQENYQVFVEAQNRFNLKGRVATVGGTPDIVAVRETDVWVIDCKSGKQKHSHHFQLLIYMLMLPLTHPACRGRSIGGEIQYRDYSVPIMPEQLTQRLKGQIQMMIERIAGDEPLMKVPSFGECRFCPVTRENCPQRMDEQAAGEVPEHGLF